MEDAEFKQYVHLITSMSVDYIVKGKLTKETYIAKLKAMVKQMELKESKK